VVLEVEGDVVPTLLNDAEDLYHWSSESATHSPSYTKPLFPQIAAKPSEKTKKE